MARRKKTSPLEDVLDLLAMLPWWVCVVVAAVSYFLLHRLAAPIQAADIQGQGGAVVGAMVQKALIHGLANRKQRCVLYILIPSQGDPSLHRPSQDRFPHKQGRHIRQGPFKQVIKTIGPCRPIGFPYRDNSACSHYHSFGSNANSGDSCAKSLY